MNPDMEKQPKSNRLVNGILIISLFLFPLAIVLFFLSGKTPAEPPEIKAIVEEWEAENKKLTSSTPPEKNAWKYYGEAAEILKMIDFGDNGDSYEKLPFAQCYFDNIDFMTAISNTVQLHPDILELADLGYKEGMVFLPVKRSHDYHKDKNAVLLGFIIVAGSMEESGNRPIPAAKRYLQAIHLGNGWFKSNGHFYCCVNNIEYSMTRLMGTMEKNKDNRELLNLILKDTERISNEWTTFKTDVVLTIYGIRDNIPAYTQYYEERQKAPDVSISDYIKCGIDKKVTIKEFTDLYPVILEYDKYSLESYSRTLNCAENFPKYQFYSTYVFNNSESDLRSFYKQYTCLHTRFEALRILAALYLYRLDNKTYPENLDALSPKYLKEIPRDTFAADGKFRYKKEKDGEIILYSVGRDMEDDGGKTDSRYEGDQEDIVFAE